MRRSRGRDTTDVNESATVYSDVSFMGRDTVAFSLRLRQSGDGIRPMGHSLVESFLPDLVVRSPHESTQFVETNNPQVTDIAAAELLEQFSGCLYARISDHVDQ
jgi:hypothetical protein